MPSFETMHRCQMSDHDVLVDLLSHPENKIARKPEIAGRDNGESGNGGDYDLTNPNLHHGVEDVYRPFHSSGLYGSSHLVDEPAAPAAPSKPLNPEVGDGGTSSNQTGYEGEASTLDVSSYFGTAAASETLTFSGS